MNLAGPYATYNKKRKMIVDSSGYPINQLLFTAGAKSEAGVVTEAVDAMLSAPVQLGDNRANYIEIDGADVGNPTKITAKGVDTNVGLTVKTKGTGTLNLESSTTRIKDRIVVTTYNTDGSSKNPLHIITGDGGACDISVNDSSTVGGSANINMYLSSKGTGNISSNAQLSAGRWLSNPNSINLNPAPLGSNPTISVGTTSGNADCHLTIQAKGKGLVKTGNGFLEYVSNTPQALTALTNTVVKFAELKTNTNAAGVFTITASGGDSKWDAFQNTSGVVQTVMVCGVIHADAATSLDIWFQRSGDVNLNYGYKRQTLTAAGPASTSAIVPLAVNETLRLYVYSSAAVNIGNQNTFGRCQIQMKLLV